MAATYSIRHAAVLTVVWVFVGLLGAAAWQVALEAPYTSGSDVGYYLGLAGGSMMLVLLTYPLRKHARFMRNWAPLRYWFRLHMICGVGGPLLILFHSTFRVGSLNATVAISCMLLVATSGIVGRFIYRKIHHGLYGSRATLAEQQKLLTEELSRIQPLLSPLPQVRQAVDEFAALAAQHPTSFRGRAAHFVLLGWHRLRVRRHIYQMLAQHSGAGAALPAQALARTMQRVDATLQGIQQTAQFSAYERLFSLWHVLHIPFVYIFVISAIVHVVAVHTY